MRTWTCAALFLAACGGEAVIDPPLGGGGAGSSGNSGTTTTTPTVNSSSTGVDMLSCEQLAQAYRDILQDLKACNSNTDEPQCETEIISDLLCPCPTFINTVMDLQTLENLEALSSVVNEFGNRGCLETAPPCPPVACEELVGAVCEGGVCIDVAN